MVVIHIFSCCIIQSQKLTCLRAKLIAYNCWTMINTESCTVISANATIINKINLTSR